MSPSARYAVCEAVLRQGSFADDIALAAGAGIGGVGVDAPAVETVGADEARRILDDHGVQASSYMDFATIFHEDGGRFPLDEAARRLDVGRRLGVPAALVMTGALGARAPAEADETCRDWLGACAALAEDRDMRIMLEPMHPLMRRWSYVHTLDHALTLVDGLEGAGVVLDLGHVWWEHGLDTLIRDHVDEIVSVQVTNVDTAALEEIRYERAPFDRGDVPVASLVGLLETSGYDGWYEDETIVRARRDQRLAMLRASREWFESL
ncbi:MAG TPA: sugar phosphate isomerase/epimerase family protein [Acidimicrobiia bacterium]